LSRKKFDIGKCSCEEVEGGDVDAAGVQTVDIDRLLFSRNLSGDIALPKETILNREKAKNTKTRTSPVGSRRLVLSVLAFWRKTMATGSSKRERRALR